MKEKGSIAFIDEPNPNNAAIAEFLEEEGYRVAQHDPSLYNPSQLKNTNPDLVIVSESAQSSVPKDLKTGKVVLLQPRTDEGSVSMSPDASKISRYLDDGADHCQTTPVNALVLVSHLDAIMRRRKEIQKPQKIMIGELEIDLASRSVVQGAKKVPLTEREREVFFVLATHYGSVLSHPEITQRVFGFIDYYRGNKVVQKYINKIRRKLHDDPEDSRYIHTVRYRGYYLLDKSTVAKEKMPGEQALVEDERSESALSGQVENAPPIEGPKSTYKISEWRIMTEKARRAKAQKFPKSYIEFATEYRPEFIRVFDESELQVDTKAQIASIPDAEKSLTPVDKRLLYYFSRQYGKILSDEDIQSAVNEIFNATISKEDVRQMVEELMQKVNPQRKEKGSRKKVIRNYPGYGFSFEVYPKAVEFYQ